MKSKDARDNYYFFTEKLSDVNRQLCFAGIATVWIFVVKYPNGNFQFDVKFLLPLTCFVLGLTFDLLHYIFSSASWGIFHRLKEKNISEEDTDFLAPLWINWIPLLFFWLKVSATLFGFGALLKIFIS